MPLKRNPLGATRANFFLTDLPRQDEAPRLPSASAVSRRLPVTEAFRGSATAGLRRPFICEGSVPRVATAVPVLALAPLITRKSFNCDGGIPAALLSPIVGRP
jgi:hypothetical protein